MIDERKRIEYVTKISGDKGLADVYLGINRIISACVGIRGQPVAGFFQYFRRNDRCRLPLVIGFFHRFGNLLNRYFFAILPENLRASSPRKKGKAKN